MLTDFKSSTLKPVATALVCGTIRTIRTDVLITNQLTEFHFNNARATNRVAWRLTMELLLIAVLGLGFFTTVIVAIVYGKDDVAKLAIKVHGEIVKILESLRNKGIR